MAAQSISGKQMGTSCLMICTISSSICNPDVRVAVLRRKITHDTWPAGFLTNDKQGGVFPTLSLKWYHFCLTEMQHLMAVQTQKWSPWSVSLPPFPWCKSGKPKCIFAVLSLHCFFSYWQNKQLHFIALFILTSYVNICVTNGHSYCTLL